MNTNTYTLKNQDTFSGFLSDWKFSGKILYTYTSGDTFQAKFLNGLIKGKSVFEDNKTKTRIEFKTKSQLETASLDTDKPIKIHFEDGAILEGKLSPSTSKLHGEVSIRSKRTDSPLKAFKGNFSQGILTEGTLEYSNGVVYKGSFDPDLNFKGLSQLNLPKSNVLIEGEFLNGEISEGKISFLGDGSVYEGQISEYKPHGKGVLKYQNGDVYEGDFRKGLKHGKGKFKRQSLGVVFEGGFENDLMNGYGSVSNGAKELKGFFYQGNLEGEYKIIDHF